MKNYSQKSFVLLILSITVLAVFLKIATTFLLVYYGKDIQKGEAWLKYVYYVKENIAKETLKIKEPKIIIVSGSNSLFGLDNTLVSQQTGFPVINMGTHAALSFDYHMSKIQSYVKKGDIVVIPLEFDYYAVDKNDSGWMIENMAFWDKKYFQTMPLKIQILWALKLSPDFYLYSMKALLLRSEKLRLESSEDIINLWDNALKNNEIKSQYNFLAIRADGTFMSSNESTFKGNSAYISQPDDKIMQRIIHYKKEIEKKGATVIFTYPATMENDLFRLNGETEQKILDSFDAGLLKNGLRLSCHLSDFHYDRSLFSDTFYHLTHEGALKRSEALGKCINEIIKKKN